MVGARDPNRIRRELELLLGESDLYEVREASVDGVIALVLADDNGELVID